jgi:ketosteroid isomerase-like protein
VSENIEVVRRIFEALARGDVEAMVRECDAEVEYVSLVAAVEGASYRGHSGVRSFFSDLTEAWDVWIPHVERFESEGDSVLAIGTSQIRGRGSGMDMEFEWGQVLRLRDGKVLYGRMYPRHEEAEQAFRAAATG